MFCINNEKKIINALAKMPWLLLPHSKVLQNHFSILCIQQAHKTLKV